MDDVKLCCRRSPSLLEFISGQSDKLRASKEGGEEGRRKGGKKAQKEATATVTIEDSD